MMQLLHTGKVMHEQKGEAVPLTQGPYVSALLVYVAVMTVDQCS